jgi:hypothetical protein
MTPDSRSPAPSQESLRSPPAAVVIARCIECLEIANPAYGSREGVYCIECAPPELRRPTIENSPGAL